MKFEIQFWADRSFAACKKGQGMNFETLQIARKLWADYESPASEFRGLIDARDWDPSVEVSEYIASRVPQLHNSNPARVTVPAQAINKYAILKRYEANGKKGLRWGMDTDRLLADWEAAGHPDEWNPGG